MASMIAGSSIMAPMLAGGSGVAAMFAGGSGMAAMLAAGSGVVDMFKGSVLLYFPDSDGGPTPQQCIIQKFNQ